MTKLISSFTPDPSLSKEENLEKYKKEIFRSKWYGKAIMDIWSDIKKGNIAVLFAGGFFFVAYPFIWLSDQSNRRLVLEKASVELDEKYRNPAFLIQAESDKALSYLRNTQTKLHKLSETLKELKETIEENPDHLLSEETVLTLKDRQLKLREQISLQEIKKEFFGKYINSLKIMVALKKTDQALLDSNDIGDEFIEFARFQNKTEELEIGLFQNLRSISEEMILCENQERAAALIDTLSKSM